LTMLSAPMLEPCRSVLDLGAGPGTASWATLATCAGITSVTQVDRSPALLAMAGRLAPAALNGRDVTITQRVADIAAFDTWPSADVVVGAYALAELSASARARVVASAWRASTRLLVLVEPGTPAGFEHIHEARAALIAAGAQILAPCPHEGPCPMRAAGVSVDWCHFAVRVPRSRLHRQVKGGTLGYEDEKYAYLVVSRAPDPARPDARVLRHPRIEKGRIALALCTPDGAQRDIVTRRDATWRAARKVDWGDPWTR
jgi:ribosomal protein RSM22 (predicted rRNA methylase)